MERQAFDHIATHQRACSPAHRSLFVPKRAKRTGGRPRTATELECETGHHCGRFFGEKVQAALVAASLSSHQYQNHKLRFGFMLQSNQRHILHFDLAMEPYPADAPAIPLKLMVEHLDKRVKEKAAVQIIDEGRRIVRLAKMENCILAGEKPGVAFLFSLGDRAKADPGFTDFETGAVRVAKPRAGEAGGLSVHAVASLEPTKPNGHLYRFLYEDVTGFGRSFIQDFLRSQFKIICDENGFSFKRDDKRDIKTRPMVRLSGHASDQLRNSLDEGRLLNIEIVEYIEKDFGFDEAKFFKSVRRNLNFSVSKNLPHGEALDFVEKVKAWAKRQGYATMRVRWKEPENKRPLTAQVDTARQDAGDVYFVRSVEVELTEPLADISEEISKELIKKMCAIMD